MSELTRCNYCSLKDYRARAKREGKVITLVKNKEFGGYDLMKHSKNEKIIPHVIDDNNPQFVGWFMAITDSCVC